MSDTPAYIKEIKIADYNCFRGNHKFSFVDEKGEWCRWTVFLGNNNTGKTNLLKKIVSIDQEKSSYAYFKKLASLENVDSDEISYTDSNYDHIIYGYGVIRTIEIVDILTYEKESSNFDNLLYNTKLTNFESWLFQLDYAAKNRQKKAAVKRDLVIKNVITSEIFPEINDIRFTSNEKAENYIEYQTKDGGYKLNELGYGYQSMLAWLMDFCKKMFDRYPESENPLKEPAVLLVDEIDLHLHPYWQRTIIQYLSNLLPQTQFIVTTHSPFILQSMENVNLYTLRREGDHTISKHLGNQSFIGWSIEEILREIMELGDDVYTDHYQKLSKQFYEAIAENDRQKAETAYNALVKILNPESVERKLMKIQLSQITSSYD